MRTANGDIDRDFIDRVMAGEKAAWDGFVEKYAGLLHGVALRTLQARAGFRGAEDAKDVVQDVFVRLVKDDFRLLGTYDPERASLSTWLTVVARSVALDFLRRPEMRRDFVELDDDMPGPADSTPQALLDIPQGVVTDRQREILRMLFDQDMDVAEVAFALSVREQTVRSLKHQALARLREHFASPRRP